MVTFIKNQCGVKPILPVPYELYPFIYKTEINDQMLSNTYVI